MNHVIFEIAAPLMRGHAYLDPGSGSFLLQLIIATLLGGVFLLKAYWAKVRAFFGKLFSRSSSDTKDE